MAPFNRFKYLSILKNYTIGYMGIQWSWTNVIRSVIYLLEYDNNIYKNRAGNHAVRAWLLNPEICGLNIFIPPDT